MEWCWQVAKDCGFLPKFGPTWHSSSLGRQAGLSQSRTKHTKRWQKWWRTITSSSWGCPPSGTRFACNQTSSPCSSSCKKFWAAHQAPGMLSCCYHGTLSGVRFWVWKKSHLLSNNPQAGEMEEAMAVLEEAEPLLKEEELAERGREGEKWASSVYLAKGRVLEALDSRPQVYLKPFRLLVVHFAQFYQSVCIVLFVTGSRGVSSCPWTGCALRGSTWGVGPTSDAHCRRRAGAIEEVAFQDGRRGGEAGRKPLHHQPEEIRKAWRTWVACAIGAFEGEQRCACELGRTPLLQLWLSSSSPDHLHSIEVRPMACKVSSCPRGAAGGAEGVELIVQVGPQPGWLVPGVGSLLVCCWLLLLSHIQAGSRKKVIWTCWY